MINTLKGKINDLSKDEIIKIIHQYIKDHREILQEDNLQNVDFDSPSWALKQAFNCGGIKTLNKLENFLPK